MAIDFTKIPSPCFVLDKSLLEKNIETLRRVKKVTGITFLMALKGFATRQVFPFIKNTADGAAVSSLNELKLAHDFLSDNLHAYAPVYLPDEFDEIAQKSQHITFNSLSQFEQYTEKAKQINPLISIGLRINPLYSDVETALYNPASSTSRLGITPENCPDKLPKDIEGLHVHTLCESSAKALEKLLEAIEKHFGKFLPEIKWLNLGGGHLMTQKDYDIPLLVKTINKFKANYPNLEIILEPSAAFVWETGYLVATILDIVENGNVSTAILDVSFTAHMPDCLEMPYKPKILSASENGKFIYRMGGNSCLAGDFIGNWLFDKPLKTGNRIVFNDMIHYTTVKTSFFNGVKHPSIGMWTPDNQFVLFKKFGYKDYKNRLS
ncbi:MAG: carboxynorspermidine decarboxylase [Bacteroidales bacterium]|nr:carboxynorspermidine decarboxylase [Bacteroidales bacterium]